MRYQSPGKTSRPRGHGPDPGAAGTQWGRPGAPPRRREIPQELTVHTVTKVLVVFAAVLCVLLAALTMAYSVNAERIVGDYRAQVNARQAAEQSASSDIGRARAEQQALNDRIADLQNKNTGLSTQLNSLQAELATSRLDLNQAKLAGDATKAQID